MWLRKLYKILRVFSSAYCVLLLLLLFSPVSSSKELPPALNVLNDFINTLKAGKCHTAYLYLSPPLRDELSYRDFKIICERVEDIKLIYYKFSEPYPEALKLIGALKALYWTEGCLYSAKLFGYVLFLRFGERWLIHQIVMSGSQDLKVLKCLPTESFQ